MLIFYRDDSETKVTPEFIKELRLKFGLTPLVFSTILGVSTRRLKQWERGSRKPSKMERKLFYVLYMYNDVLPILYSVRKNDGAINLKDIFEGNGPKERMLKLDIIEARANTIIANNKIGSRTILETENKQMANDILTCVNSLKKQIIMGYGDEK